MTTLEQIDEFERTAVLLYEYNGVRVVGTDYLKELCTLAKERLATRKRPIEEAPKTDGVDLLVFGIQDGRPYTDIVRVSGNGFLAFDPLADRYCHESSGHTHFIPLSALEEE